jgi:hypothetical protein
MNTFDRIIERLDANEPRYIDGKKQGRLSSQLAFVVGILVGCILSYFLF